MIESDKSTNNKSIITRIHFLVVGFAFHITLNNEGNLFITLLIRYMNNQYEISYIKVYIKCLYF